MLDRWQISSIRLCVHTSEIGCFLANVCPTAAHLPLPWVMGYDVEPLVTLESKQALWARAVAEGWLLIFEHDPEIAWGRLDPGADRPSLLEASIGR